MKNLEYEEHPTKAYRIVMKDEDGEEMGYAWVNIIINTKRDAPYGLLEDVYLDERHRGKALGDTLVEAAIEKARSEGCYKFLATTRNSKEKVQNWYLKLGLKEWGKEYRIDFFDAPSKY